MKITTITITMALALITIMPNARAEIASKAYVDDQDTYFLFGGEPLDPKYEGDLIEIGGIYGAISNTSQEVRQISTAMTHAVGKEQLSSKSNALMVTDSGGNISTATGGYITDGNINPSAAIQLGKLAMPTPPQICETKGCMLMYYNGKYVWEVVERDTSETISTAGYVTATATGSNATVTGAKTLED